MTRSARALALSLASQSRYEREIGAAQSRQSAESSRSATLVDHDPVTGADVFRTASGGTVRARTLSSSGLPFGSQRNLLAGAGAAQLYYDEQPQPVTATAAEAEPPEPYSPLLTDGDPNLAGEDDFGDPSPIAPRGNPSDFAIDTTTDTAYYSKPGDPRSWVAIGGKGGVLFGEVLPWNNTSPAVVNAREGALYIFTETFDQFFLDETEVWRPVSSLAQIGGPLSPGRYQGEAARNINDGQGFTWNDNAGQWRRPARITIGPSAPTSTAGGFESAREGDLHIQPLSDGSNQYSLWARVFGQWRSLACCDDRPESIGTEPYCIDASLGGTNCGT